MNSHVDAILTPARDARWADAWSALHVALTSGTPASSDDRLAWAASTLEDAFFAALTSSAATESGASTPSSAPVASGRPDDVATALETVVLLHGGGLHRLSSERFDVAVSTLVARHRAAGALDAARRFARFRPDLPVCAAVLNDAPAGENTSAGDGVVGADVSMTPAADPVCTSHDHPQSDVVTVTSAAPTTSAVRTRSLFRSPVEARFYRAARRVFPTHLPLPNAALSSVLDANALKPFLSGPERRLLYTGAVDLVLVDPAPFESGRAMMPVAFFEIDSTYHDAPDRKHNDTLKDRIVAAAGHRLVRLRPHAPDVTVDAFAAILRSLHRTECVRL